MVYDKELQKLLRCAIDGGASRRQDGQRSSFLASPCAGASGLAQTAEAGGSGGVAQVGRGMGGAALLTPHRAGLPPQLPEATSAPQEQVGLPLSGPALSLLQQAPQRAQGRYLTLCVLECSIHVLYPGSHVSQDPSLHSSRIDGVHDEL